MPAIRRRRGVCENKFVAKMTQLEITGDTVHFPIAKAGRIKTTSAIDLAWRGGHECCLTAAGFGLGKGALGGWRRVYGPRRSCGRCVFDVSIVHDWG